MSKYIPFTTEQKERAASVDLEEFLRRRGEKLITSGRDKRLASDHSITIRGCEWFDHATEQGGRAISFVKQFYGLSYPDAMSLLLGDDLGGSYPAAEEKEPEPAKPFVLPPQSESMRRVYAYLLKQRCIDREILNAFVRKKLVYESCERSRDGTKEYHNAVFVGFDEHGVSRHGHKRGLYTMGQSYRGNIEGSDPKHSFHYLGGDDTLYVFEAPIDLLSYLSLFTEGWQEHNYVACCGTSSIPVTEMLRQLPQRRQRAEARGGIRRDERRIPYRRYLGVGVAAQRDQQQKDPEQHDQHDERQRQQRKSRKQFTVVVRLSFLTAEQDHLRCPLPKIAKQHPQRSKGHAAAGQRAAADPSGGVQQLPHRQRRQSSQQHRQHGGVGAQQHRDQQHDADGGGDDACLHIVIPRFTGFAR